MALSTAAAFSDWFEDAILVWFKGTATKLTTAPTTEYVGLFTANPADTGTTGGTADGTEVTTSNGATGFSNYARIALTASSGWNAIAAATGDSTGQQISNAAQIGGVTAWTNNGGSTVTITGVGLWSASSAGNLYVYFPLTASQALANGSAFAIAASGLVLQVD